MRRIIVVATAAAAVSVATSAQALAALKVCVGGPTTAITMPYKAGTCPKGKALTSLALDSEVAALQSEIAALQATLSKVSYHPSGLNGQPTLEISGANVQIDNGAGSSSTLNGLGNLFIGSDERPGTQTGSNNLVLGTDQSFSSWGGVIGGDHNTDTGPNAAVFGFWNTVGPFGGELSAGGFNTASGDADVVFGQGNSADGSVASVLGGHQNVANGAFSSILGGNGTTLTGNCETFPATAQPC
jgi:hypothetical protein